MFYVSLMITAKQNPIVDTQKRKKKESKHITTMKSQRKSKRKQKGTKRNYKTGRKKY